MPTGTSSSVPRRRTVPAIVVKPSSLSMGGGQALLGVAWKPADSRRSGAYSRSRVRTTFSVTEHHVSPGW